MNFSDIESMTDSELANLPLVDMDKLDLDELHARFGDDGKTKLENKEYLKERDRPYAVKVCKKRHKENWGKFSNSKKEELVEKELLRVEKVREKDANNIERGVVDRTFKYEEFNYYPTEEDYHKAREELLRKMPIKFRTNDLYQMLLKDELDSIVRYKASRTEMATFTEKIEDFFITRKNALDSAKIRPIPGYRRTNWSRFTSS